MFGFHYVIFNLLMGLTFLVPRHTAALNVGHTVTTEEIITSAHHQSYAVIELGFDFNQLVNTSKTSKLPFPNHSDAELSIHSVTYAAKLLYFHIGNAIELELTSTTIIFPFHCFT